MFRKDPTHTGFSSEEAFLTPPLELIWKSEGAVGGSPSSPAVYDGKVFIEFAGRLYAHDANTGELLWSVSTSISDHASVAVGHGMVFDGSGKHPSCENCGVVAHDIETGEEVWRLVTAPPNPPNAPRKGARQPVLNNGVLYFGSDDWYVRAANALTGQLLWTSPKLNEGIVAVPAVSDGKVFVGTWGGRLYALEALSGEVLWYFSTGGVTFSSPSIVNGTLYIGSGTERVYAINVEDGTEKWRYTGGSDSVWGSPATAYGSLYIQDLAGRIHSLNLNDGSLNWYYQTSAAPSSSRSSPAVANGVVYVGSQDGSVYGFDAFTGEVLWQYETGGPIQDSSPAIADSMLYIASSDGYLYAFGNVDDEGTPLDVPDIKQYSPPWSDQVYDNATSWSENPTIERWGCALTSASMVLQYFGHNFDPSELNSWLKFQPDGYIRNGLLNWLAISRLTFLNNVNDSPVLEFRRFSANTNILSEELEQGRPAILKVPGHFVVAKGTENSDFIVNDPGSTKTLLSEVEVERGDEFSVIESYIPSSTDLSYIFLVIDKDLVLEVTGPDGPIGGDYFFDEEALKDNVTRTSLSGPSLKSFLYPKPSDGQYDISLTGNGAYLLDSYIYNSEGEVSTYSFSGISTGEKDTFLLSVGSETELLPFVTIDSLIKDLKNGYEQGLIGRLAYRNLKRTLYWAKDLITQDKKIFAKSVLRGFAVKLRYLKPLLIDQEIFDILSQNTYLLISSL